MENNICDKLYVILQESINKLNFRYCDFDCIKIRMNKSTLQLMLEEKGLSLNFPVTNQIITYLGYKIEIEEDFPDNRIDIIDISNNIHKDFIK